jgi:hypothetical protein
MQENILKKSIIFVSIGWLYSTVTLFKKNWHRTLYKKSIIFVSIGWPGRRLKENWHGTLFKRKLYVRHLVKKKVEEKEKENLA